MSPTISKHPSLIALSNDECYGGKLLLPPSPYVQTADFGLSLVQTPRGHYDRGGTSRDLIQAEQVAKAVADHIKRCPNKSLGVACLSAQQRDGVEDMIDKLGIRSEADAFTPKGERLFVKNLEAIQGDERDVIFISVGYGVAQDQSRPFLQFGPVSREGGDRRLNVLASRAREKCVVFSSITAADIPANSPARGTRMLRALLHFAETGKLGAGSVTGGDFDSPFEEAVARVIREAGYHVHSQVGVLACTRFRRHRVRCFDGAGGDGNLVAVSLIHSEMRGRFLLAFGIFAVTRQTKAGWVQLLRMRCRSADRGPSA